MSGEELDFDTTEPAPLTTKPRRSAAQLSSGPIARGKSPHATRQLKPTMRTIIAVAASLAAVALVVVAMRYFAAPRGPIFEVVVQPSDASLPARRLSVVYEVVDGRTSLYTILIREWRAEPSASITIQHVSSFNIDVDAAKGGAKQFPVTQTRTIGPLTIQPSAAGSEFPLDLRTGESVWASATNREFLIMSADDHIRFIWPEFLRADEGKVQHLEVPGH